MNRLTPDMIHTAQRLATGLQNVIDAAVAGRTPEERHAISVGAVAGLVNGQVTTASKTDPELGRLVGQTFTTQVDRALGHEQTPQIRKAR